MLAHVRKNLLTVMALQSPQHLTSPDLADVLLLPEGALLSRCSCPVWMRQNIGSRQYFTVFHRTLAAFEMKSKNQLSIINLFK